MSETYSYKLNKTNSTVAYDICLSMQVLNNIHVAIQLELLTYRPNYHFIRWPLIETSQIKRMISQLTPAMLSIASLPDTTMSPEGKWCVPGGNISQRSMIRFFNTGLASIIGISTIELVPVEQPLTQSSF